MSRTASRARTTRTRPFLTTLMVFVASVIGALTGIAPANAATPQFSYWDTAPVVSGTAVSFDSYIGASPAATVRNLSTCIRDQNGTNLDLAPVNGGGNVTIKTDPNGGYSLVQTATLAPGVYTFGTCFQLSSGSTWYGSIGHSNVANFTVDAASTPPSTGLTTAPIGNVNGFTQLWTEDFTKNSAAGAVGTDYADRLHLTPDGQRGTNDVGVYENSRNLSVHDGTLDLTEQHTADGTDTSGAQIWFLNDVDNDWAYTGGRFSIRMKADFNVETAYGVCNLLWPIDNVWNEGEVDFPEGSLGGDALLNQHKMAPENPDLVNLHAALTDGFQEWHTWTIEWKPGASLTYYLDGTLFASDTNPAHVPTSEHVWVLQALNAADVPIPAGAVAHVKVDWATAYSEAG